MKRFFIFLLLTCVGVAASTEAYARDKPRFTARQIPENPGAKKPVAKGTLVSASAERDAELRRLMNELGTDKDALMKAAASKATVASNTGEETKLSKGQRRRQKAKDKKAAASVSGTGSDVEGDSDTSFAPAPAPVVHTQPRGAPRGEPRPTLPVTASVTGTKSALPPPRGTTGERPPVTASPPRGVPAPMMGTGFSPRGTLPVVLNQRDAPQPPPGLQMGRSPARPVWPKPHGSDQLGDTDTFPPIPTATHGASPRSRHLTKGQAAVGLGSTLPPSPVHSVDTDEEEAQQRFGFSSPPSHRSRHSRRDSMTFAGDDLTAGLVDDADNFGAGKDALKPANKPIVTPAVDATAIVTGQHTLRVAALDESDADDASSLQDKDLTHPAVVPAGDVQKSTLITWFDEWSETHFDGFALNKSALESESWVLSGAWEDQTRFWALLKANNLSQTTTTPEYLQVVYLASCADSPQARTAGLNILGGSVYGISDAPMTGDQFRLTLWSLYSLVKGMEVSEIERSIYASQGIFTVQQHEQHRHDMLLCALAVKADVDKVFGDSRMATIAGWTGSEPTDVERDLSALETHFDMPGYLVRRTKFPSTMEDVD